MSKEIILIIDKKDVVEEKTIEFSSPNILAIVLKEDALLHFSAKVDPKYTAKIGIFESIKKVCGLIINSGMKDHPGPAQACKRSFNIE